MGLRRRRFVKLSAGACFFAGCLETTPERDDIASSDDVLNIAHRGSMYLWPENTLLSLEKSIETGADIVEFDLDVTADGTIVLMHDETVDRTTDGSGPIAEKTLGEVKELDAGYTFPPEMHESYVTADVEHEHLPDSDEVHPFRGQGIEVPTLEEAFEVIPDDFPVILDIKRKRAEPQRLAQLLEEFDRVDSTLVGAFESSFLDEMRAVKPELDYGLGAAGVRQFLLTNRASEHRYQPGVEFFFPPNEIVRPQLVERAHRNGMSVLTWTVNDPAEMRRLLGIPVDGILTDDHVFQQQIMDRYLD